MSIVISGDSPNFTSATLTTPVVTTTIGVGGATPAASGAGITFPATQSASTDANTLDDYEEGTWTVTDSSGAGLTFTNNTGQYIKIGRMVYFQFDISFPTTANGSNINFSLPFASQTPSGSNGCSGGAAITYTSKGSLSTYVYSNTLKIYSTAGASQVNSALSNSEFAVTGSYYASA